MLLRRRLINFYPRMLLNHLLVVLVFYFNTFVVPTCMGGLHPIPNFQWFNCFIHIPPFIKCLWQIIQQSDCAFSIDLKDAYYHISVVKCHHNFVLYLFGKINVYSGRFCHLGWPQVVLFSHLLVNLFCFFFGTDFHSVIYLDDLIHSV